MTEHDSRALKVDEQTLADVWDRHLAAEFAFHNIEDALATMTEDAYVLNVSVGTGGYSKAGVRDFYTRFLIPQLPPDIEVIPVARTIGVDHLVDEAVYRFTHSVQMDWFLPGVAPTGRRIEWDHVAIVKVKAGRVVGQWAQPDLWGIYAQLTREQPAPN